jgi:hypothetical protein
MNTRSAVTTRLKQSQSRCTNDIQADRMPSVQQNLETSTSVIAKPTCRCGVLAEPGAMGSDVSDVHGVLDSKVAVVRKRR